MEWMDPTGLAKQMIGLQKNMFENIFNIVAVLQNQTESATSNLLDQATWLPEEGKNAINEWVKACKRGREDYKKMIDDGFKNMERFLP